MKQKARTILVANEVLSCDFITRATGCECWYTWALMMDDRNLQSSEIADLFTNSAYFYIYRMSIEEYIHIKVKYILTLLEIQIL
jgi:hypothetical protein